MTRMTPFRPSRRGRVLTTIPGVTGLGVGEGPWVGSRRVERRW
jgi:hypothetical protein